MRKRSRLQNEIQPCMKNKLYKESNCKLSSISPDERDYIRGWCSGRHLEDSYAIRAVVFWVRIRLSLSVFFRLKDTNKMVYMVLCIHIAMKWQGYTEMHKCNFIGDLREIDPSISICSHQEMEYHVITNLDWNFGP